jgi:type III pantothenate kinase
MQSGIYWGYISKVEGIIKKIKREFGSEMNVIATGGFASVFSEDFSLIDIVDKDLTLKGLLEVSKRSK